MFFLRPTWDLTNVGLLDLIPHFKDTTFVSNDRFGGGFYHNKEELTAATPSSKLLVVGVNPEIQPLKISEVLNAVVQAMSSELPELNEEEAMARFGCHENQRLRVPMTSSSVSAVVYHAIFS